MAIITISRGSYFRGKEIAQKVAQKLGYDCISREDLLKNSKEYNIPEIKLLHAFEHEPSILDRFTHGKEKYIAYIQAALLRQLSKDNVVYHGFAFHFFIKDMPCVLKVRIIAELEDRIKFVMERDKIPKKRASSFVRKIDGQRKKWSQSLYGIDPSDPGLYDLVLLIGDITTQDAVEIISHVAGLKEFQTTSESKRIMSDLALAAEVKAALVDLNTNIEVSAEGGIVAVKIEIPLAQDWALMEKMMKIGEAIKGVKGINFFVEGLSHDADLFRAIQPSLSTQSKIRTYFAEFG